MERVSAVGPGGDRRPSRVVSVAVGLHLVAAVAHGAVHEAIPVHLAEWQTAIVALAVFVGPVVGAGLAVTGRRRVGGALVAASLTAAFGFELLAHFVVPNPDHVGLVSSHRAAFATTAAFSLATDGIGALASAWCWRRG